MWTFRLNKSQWNIEKVLKEIPHNILGFVVVVVVFDPFVYNAYEKCASFATQGEGSVDFYRFAIRTTIGPKKVIVSRLKEVTGGSVALLTKRLLCNVTRMSGENSVWYWNIGH